MEQDSHIIKLIKNKMISILCIILILLSYMSSYTNVIAYDGQDTINSINEKNSSQIDIGDKELIIKDDNNLRKTEVMEQLNWIRDTNDSIGSITITNNGKTINMTGNNSKPGKNAIYIIPDVPQEQRLQFGYNVEFGDSFNAAGLLLKVKKVNNTLTGYMLSFNYKWTSEAGGKLRCNMEIYISIGK